MENLIFHTNRILILNDDEIVYFSLKEFLLKDTINIKKLLNELLKLENDKFSIILVVDSIIAKSINVEHFNLNLLEATRYLNLNVEKLIFSIDFLT